MRLYLNRNFLISHKIKLIETILFTHKTGFFLLKYHIQRLGRSAFILNYSFNKAALLRRLHLLKKKSLLWDKVKIRLALDHTGGIQIETSEFKEPQGKLICFSDKSVNSQDALMYHKTSYRPLYTQEFSKLDPKTHLDIIFLNERDEVTEGSRSNIIIEDKNDVLFTPPESSGLLNGTYRQYLLKFSKHLKEKVLTREDLIKAQKIYLCNSIYKLKEVSLDDRSEK